MQCLSPRRRPCPVGITTGFLYHPRGLIRKQQGLWEPWHRTHPAMAAGPLSTWQSLGETEAAAGSPVPCPGDAGKREPLGVLAVSSCSSAHVWNLAERGSLVSPAGPASVAGSWRPWVGPYTGNFHREIVRMPRRAEMSAKHAYSQLSQ